MILYILLALVSVVHISYRTLYRWLTQERPRNAINGVRPAPYDREDELNLDLLCEIPGSGGEIASLVCLPDGKRLATVCKDDGSIRLWNVDHRREIVPRMNVGVGVNALAVSKDAKWIASGGIDGFVAVWDSESYQRMGKSPEPHRLKITSLDFSPDSLRVASGADDGVIIVWRIGSAPGEPTLRCELTLFRNQDTSPVSSVKFSPAGGRIASGYSRSGYHTIQVWHSWTGQRLASIPTDGQLTRSLAWSSDGRRLFSGGPHGSIRCFDVATRRRLASREDSQSDVVTSLCVSNTGQFLISASASARIIDIWDTRDNSTLKHIHSYRRSDILSAAISPDGHHLLHAGKEKRIYQRPLLECSAMENFYFFHHVCFSSTLSEPLTHVSNAVHEKWASGELAKAEEILSREVTQRAFHNYLQYALANRSLVRARLGQRHGALEDVDAVKAHGDQELLIAYIAKGIALYGQGWLEGELGVCDAIDGNNIESFNKDIKDGLHNRNSELADSVLRVIDVCSSARKHAADAEQFMREGKCGLAIELLTAAPDLSQYISDANTIFLIFGWNVYDLQFMLDQLKFQAFAISGRTKEARKLFDLCEANEEKRLLSLYNTNEKMEARKGIFGRLREKFGDKSMCEEKYDDAIDWYTEALDLARINQPFPDLVERCLKMFEEMNGQYAKKNDPIALYIDMLSGQSQRIISLLLKRSKAREAQKLWEDALKDVNEAIQLDSQNQWAYERRDALMHAWRDHEKGTDAKDDIPSKVKKCLSELPQNDRSRQKVIDAAIHKISGFCPLVLIDVKTGSLCDKDERERVFKNDREYKSLLSASAQPDDQRIVDVVVRFFRYVMFSHRWEGKEPSFQDISKLPEKSVHRLDLSHPLNQKLNNFCEKVKSDYEGYRWAWSDTCCIDKEVETTYKTSIRSMYSWYKWSALTLVLLTDVPDTAVELKDSVWMTRVWTLQELLSPKIIRFYTRDWRLYRNDRNVNHKASAIMRELASAIHIAPNVLVDFSPETLGVRQKLRLASSRKATFEQDIAYSLIGIFDSELTPEPRHPDIAFGLLMQEVLGRYQEATVLDWTGESSTYNTCLPAQISVYGGSPYMVPSIAEDVMKKRIAELRNLPLLVQKASEIYQNLSSRLTFAARCLTLPCITFSVTVDATTDQPSKGTPVVYPAKVSGLGDLKLTTRENLSSHHGGLVLVYPWLRSLLSQAKLPEADNETNGLRLVVYLEQPFRALLLAKHAEEYRRVAADVEISVPKHKLSSLEGVEFEKLEVV